MAKSFIAPSMYVRIYVNTLFLAACKDWDVSYFIAGGQCIDIFCMLYCEVSICTPDIFGAPKAPLLLFSEIGFCMASCSYIYVCMYVCIYLSRLRRRGVR